MQSNEQNLKFKVAYDGSIYFGSQKQPDKHTVEDELLKAFKRLNIKTKIVFSGRTDRGVHASGQIFNAFIPKHWDDLKKLKKVLNHQLDPSVKILHISHVDENFHSRFSAKRRTYRYLLTTKETNPFNQKYITYEENIDVETIKKAIKEFVGVHDFKYFHKTGSDKELTKREIYEVDFYKYKDIYVIKFVANSYLRSQIRLMVGALLAISNKKLTIEELKEQLALKKHNFKTPASANGLYLAKITY